MEPAETRRRAWIGGKQLGILAPDLPREREVELLADRAAEPATQHAGERLPFRIGSGGRKRLPGQVHGHAERERRGGVRQEVGRLQREVDPSSVQPDPAVARALQKVRAEELLQELEDLRIRGRMKPMAAEVHPHAVHLEAGRVAADQLAALQHLGREPALGQPQCGAQPRRDLPPESGCCSARSSQAPSKRVPSSGPGDGLQGVPRGLGGGSPGKQNPPGPSPRRPAASGGRRP